MTRPDGNRLLRAAWFALLSVPAAVAAYYRIFTWFYPWDDEGTLLAIVRQYLSGAKPYEEIFSPYGPVYFYYKWLLHAVIGVALTHNAVRITSAIAVLVCSLGCAWLVLRFTHSLVSATIVHLSVFRVLEFFGFEPGHPQELCLLLLLCLAASGVWAANPRMRAIGLALAGSLAACLLLVKVNVGIFAILAVALAVTFQGPVGWWIRAARLAASAAALALPFLLLRSHLDDPAGQAYCFIVTVSLAALIFGPLLFGPLASAGSGWFSNRDCAAALAAFFLTLGAAMLVMAVQHVGFATLMDMLVFKHVSLSVNQRTYYLALDLGWISTLRGWMAWSLAGLCAAVLAARAKKAGVARLPQLLASAQFLVGGLGLCYALALPKLLVPFVTPFCWLLLYPPQPADARDLRARILLCTAAVLQTLYAYPRAGSQAFFVRVLLIVVAGVAFADGLRALTATARFGPVLRRVARPLTAGILMGAGLAYPLIAIRAERLYSALTPLALPGADRIHVARREAAEYHWLVSNLTHRCDTFVGLPGMPSLYFWTGKPLPGPAHKPPGRLSMDDWMLSYSAEEQRAVVDDLDRHPGACAFYSPAGVYLWYKTNPDLSDLPLANYIQTRFQTVDRMGDFQFMIRRELVDRGGAPAP
jgi:hypothetical protein